jgi:hypothetical protein
LLEYRKVAIFKSGRDEVNGRSQKKKMEVRWVTV